MKLPGRRRLHRPLPMPSTRGVGLYAAVARVLPLNYGNKILLVAFLGINMPLLSLIAAYAMTTAPDANEVLRVLGIALAATLVGAALALVILNGLLRPILMTSQGLRRYTADRILPELPTGFTDDAGTLMSDTVASLSRLDAMLDDLAYLDPVTGLPNRDHLLRQLADRLQAGELLALCVIELRNLPAITAAFGQAGADAAMRLLARRLLVHAGHSTPLARLDGGRFAFALDPSLAEPTLAVRIEAIVAALCLELGHGSMILLPEFITGVAIAPDDARTAEALLNAAQAAIPATGLPSPAYFSPTAQAEARNRLDMERDLRRALERGEFLLHYQPVLRATGNGPPRILGAEALLRWNHPTRGMISPATFIPVAEQAGLMDPIGLWVLRTGCAELRAWADAGLPALRLAVNLSAKQFAEHRLIESIAEALAAHGVSPGLLEVEMTESAAMHDRDMTRRVFNALHVLGVTIAIDDFGTGYSTLGHLRELRFDRLKIDQEFVRNVHADRSSQAICRALMELAGGLDLEVLAEGVETPEEVAWLRSNGCALFQGFYFGRPIPAEAFVARVRADGAAAA